MSEINKHYTFQEYLEKFSSIQDSYEKYFELQKKNDELQYKIKDIKAQLDYLETYSSREDVYEDMSRRLNRIEKIIGDSSNE